MIDLYYWPTPNGWKISIMLEECGLPYNLVPVDLNAGDQFKPEFLVLSPNNRMPAIVDHDETGEDGAPFHLFESGAILTYLAEKTGQFCAQDRNARYEVMQWLYWQVGGLGPMAGQLSHFVNYAPGDHPYSHTRYANEYNRLLGIMDKRLADREFLAGDYSIADMACWPWVTPYKRFEAEEAMAGFANLTRWKDAIKARPAVVRGMNAGKELRVDPKEVSEESKRRLFGQTAESVSDAAEKVKNT